MEASCQCRLVKFTTPTSKPLAIYICHCLECRAQSSSAFGISVIFLHFTLPSSDNIKFWTRSTDSGRTLRCYFCTTCGSRLLHESVSDDDKLGRTVSIKGGCFGQQLGYGELDLKKAIHIWTDRAVVDIPDGVERYVDDGPEV
ncbi:Mss4-like protein [Flagelloscypha sp. PMI_526]|nr:Mss4-like protein [Flagelloscypha sp. PMI_526]